MARSLAEDQLKNFKFHVNLMKNVGDVPGSQGGGGGNLAASIGFAAVDGLAVNIQNIEYREGGMNTTSRKLPGQASFGPITLSRGVTLGKPQAWAWVLELFAAQQGNGIIAAGDAGFRCDADIYVMEHPISTAKVNGVFPYKVKYRLYNCWPSGLIFSNLDAGGNQIFMEQLVLQHEGFEMFLATGATGNYVQ